MNQASTILHQLGGYERLRAMIGIKDVFSCQPADNPSETVSGPALVFKFCGSRKVNFCVVTLDRGRDTYTMEIGKVIYTTGRVRWYYRQTDLYSMDLAPAFADFTQLRLSL